MHKALKSLYLAGGLLVSFAASAEDTNEYPISPNAKDKNVVPITLANKTRFARFDNDVRDGALDQIAAYTKKDGKWVPFAVVVFQDFSPKEAIKILKQFIDTESFGYSGPISGFVGISPFSEPEALADIQRELDESAKTQPKSTPLVKRLDVI